MTEAAFAVLTLLILGWAVISDLLGRMNINGPLFFLVAGALERLVHLGYGLALILAFIGAKLVLHWAHGVWPATPEVPTLASLAVILGILGTVTATSLLSTRNRHPAERESAPAGPR